MKTKLAFPFQKEARGIYNTPGMNDNNKDKRNNNSNSQDRRDRHNWGNKNRGNSKPSSDKNRQQAAQQKNRNDRHKEKQRHKQNNGGNNNGRTSFQRNNNYGFPRIENEVREPREERAPSLSVPVDDHPRAMVLPFDQKAVEDVKPRKYTSGFEIYKISMNLARWLTYDDYLNKLSAATGVPFADKAFIKLEGESIDKLKAYSDSRLSEAGLEKALRAFYKYMSYFASYAKENKTAVVFDL